MLHFCLTYNFPQDLWLLGQTKYSVYDQVDTIDPALLHQYYGVRGFNADSVDDEADSVSEEDDRQSQQDIVSGPTSTSLPLNREQTELGGLGG